jgi:putative Mg2+ transporter-C (MgtC) family protein
VPEPAPVFSSLRLDFLLLASARLALAALLGALLGIQRERVHSAAGLRTHILVAVGAALIILSGIQSGFGHDASSRVIQGIVAGIGFLGAGTILKIGERVEVHGLTTAASIWMTAAVGVAAGLCHLWLSGVATVIGWLVLGPLKRLEKRQTGEGSPRG